MVVVPDAGAAVAWYVDALGGFTDPLGPRWSVGDGTPLQRFPAESTVLGSGSAHVSAGTSPGSPPGSSGPGSIGAGGSVSGVSESSSPGSSGIGWSGSISG